MGGNGNPPQEWGLSDVLSKILIVSLTQGWGKQAYEVMLHKGISPTMLGNPPAKELLRVFLETEGAQNWPALRKEQKGTPLVDYASGLQTKLDPFPISEAQTELPKVCRQLVQAFNKQEARAKGLALAELASNPATTYEALMAAYQDLAAWQPDTDDNGIVMIGDLLPEFETTITAMQEGNITALCVPTGIGVLDACIYGLKRGGYTIVAGNTGTGKSSLAGEIAARVAAQGMGVLFATGEMTPLEVYERLISARSGWSNQSMMENKTNWEDVRQAAHELGGLNIAFNQKPTLTLRGIEQWFKRMIATTGKSVDLIVVDYSRLVVIEGKGRLEQMDNLGVQLKQLAENLMNPDGLHPALLVVWDGNRQNMNGGRVEWQSSDIAYAGDKDADCVICFSDPCWLVDQGHRGNVSDWVDRYNRRYAKAIAARERIALDMGMFEGYDRIPSYRSVQIIKWRKGAKHEIALYFNELITAFKEAPPPRKSLESLYDDVKDMPF